MESGGRCQWGRGASGGRIGGIRRGRNESLPQQHVRIKAGCFRFLRATNRRIADNFWQPRVGKTVDTSMKHTEEPSGQAKTFQRLKRKYQGNLVPPLEVDPCWSLFRSAHNMFMLCCLCVACWSQGVSIIFAANPVRVGHWPEARHTFIHAISVEGNRVLTSGPAGIQWLDFGDPSQPRRLASFEHSFGQAIYLSKDHAFVADFGVVKVVDLAAPGSPKEVHRIDVGARGMPLLKGQGDHLIVSVDSNEERAGKVLIFDISTASNPIWMGSAATPSRVYHLAANLNIAVLGMEFGFPLQILDISDPKKPSSTATMELEKGRYLSSLWIDGERLFLSLGYELSGPQSELLMFDMTVSSSPKLMRRWMSSGYPGQLAAQGSHAYWGVSIKDGPSQVWSVDLFDSQAPLRVINPSLGFSMPAAVDGNRLWLTDYSGVQLLDISDRANPRVAGHFYDGSGQALDLADNKLYLADGHAGLHVFNLDRPLRPTLLTNHVTGGFVADVAVAEQRVVLAARDKVRVLELESNSGLKVLRDFPSTMAQAVAVWNGTALVVDQGKGLQAFDIGPGKDAVKLGELALSGPIRRIAVSEGFACIAAEKEGWYLVDVRNPSQLKLVGKHPPLSSISDVAMTARHVYLIDYETGLHVINLANPEAPARVSGLGRSHNFSHPYSISVFGNRGVLVESLAQRWLDLTNPSAPTEVGSVQALPGSATEDLRDVVQRGRVFYAAKASGGLVILEEPVGPGLLSWFPFDSDARDRVRPWQVLTGGDMERLRVERGRLEVSERQASNGNSSQRVFIDLPTLNPQSFTVALNFNPGLGRGMTLLEAGVYRPWLGLFIRDGRVGVRLNGVPTELFAPLRGTITNAWHQLLCSVDLSLGRISLVLNGQSGGWIDLPSGFRFENVGVAHPGEGKDIGLGSFSPVEDFVGLLDEIKVFDRAMSSAEMDDYALNFAPLDFVNGDVQTGEESRDVALRLIRFGSLFATNTLQVVTEDRGAKAGEDYVGRVETVVFLPGEAERRIHVILLPDGRKESDESFAIKVVDVATGALRAAAVVTLRDDDPGTGFRTNRYEVSESVPELALEIERGNDGNEPLELEWSTRSGTAMAGLDFTERKGTLKFAPGETMKTIVIPILADMLFEPVETFRVELRDPGNTVDWNGYQVAEVRILDEEARFRWNTAVVETVETAGPFRFKILREGQSRETNRVRLTFLEETARHGHDYMATNFVLTFPPGQTENEVMVPIVNDGIPELTETFRAKLEAIPGDAPVEGPSEIVVTIRDDDSLFSSSGSELQPVLVSEWPGYRRTPVLDLAVANNALLVAGHGVQVFDATTGQRHGRWINAGVNGLVSSILVSGKLAYVAEYGFGLRVLDITNPLAPVELGTVRENEFWNLEGMAERDQTIFLTGTLHDANGPIGTLWVFDVSNPARPVRSARYQQPGYHWHATRPVFAGSHLLINGGPKSGVWDGALTLLDISDAPQPGKVAGFGGDLWSSAVEASGDFAYLALGGPLAVLDIRNPSRPVETSRINRFQPAQLRRVNSRLYVAGLDVTHSEQSLAILDLEDPGSPKPMGSVPLPQPGFPNRTALVVEGDKAFIGDLEYGVHVVDVARPSHPAVVSRIATGGDTFQIALFDHYALLADGPEGLRILDVSNPRQPKEVGRLSAPGMVVAVQVADGRGVLGVEDAGRASLWRLDLSHPSEPRILGSFDLGVGVQNLSIHLQGNEVRVGYSTWDQAKQITRGQLRILEFTGTGGLAQRHEVKLENELRAVSFNTANAYLIEQSVEPTQGGLRWKLHRLDLASAPSPSLRLVSEGIGRPFALAARGNRCFVSLAQPWGSAQEELGLLSIELDDAGKIRRNEFLPGTRQEALTLDGSLLFGNSPNGQIDIYEISETRSSRMIGRYFADYVGPIVYRSGLGGVKLKEGYIFAPSFYDGLRILDFSSRAEFTQAAFDGIEESRGVTVKVRRRGLTSIPAEYSWVAKPGTATEGQDYAISSGVLSFAPNEFEKSLFLAVLDDSLNEGVETLTLELKAHSEAASIGTISNATLRIVDQPLVVVGFHDHIELVDEAAGHFEARVRRSGDILGEQSLRVEAMDQTAVHGKDYDFQPFTLRFEKGEAEKIVRVGILDDTVFEGQESFTLALKAVESGTVLGSTSNLLVQIQDNESTISFESFASSEIELTNHVELRVIRKGGLDQAASVVASTVASALSTNKAAIAGQDFKALSVRLDFTPGQVTNFVHIPLINDVEREGLESFRVVLTDPSPGTVVFPFGTNEVTIFDNDLGFQFAVSSPVLEVAEGVGNLMVDVSRGSDAQGVVSVGYATGNSDALAGSDFEGIRGVLEFGPGEFMKQIRLPILNDTQSEPSESFNLVLRSPSTGASLGQFSELRISIRDDDPTIRFISSNYAFTEGDGSITVEVMREAATAGTASVRVQSRNGTAIAGSDYEAQSSIIRFAAGEVRRSIQIRLLDDAAFEPLETFDLILSDPVGAQLLAPSVATIQVRDNDQPATEFNFKSVQYRARELDGSIPITLTRSAPHERYDRVQLTGGFGTATPGLDCSSLNQTVYFGYGQSEATVYVAIYEDDLTEFDEFLLLTLQNPVSDSGGPVKIGSTNTALLTIQNAGQVVEWSSGSFFATENSKSVELAIRRRGETDAPISVRVSSTPQSALPGIDYASQDRIISLQPNQLFTNISVSLMDNRDYGGFRSFLVALSEAGGGAIIGSISNAVVTIGDDERPGLVDGSFVSVLSPGSFITGMAIQSDGRIVLAGGLRSSRWTGSKPLIRVMPDGGLDSNYREGGDRIQRIDSMVMDSRGGIIAAGLLKGLPESQRIEVFRILPDGSWDASYRDGVGSLGLKSLNQAKVLMTEGDKVYLTGWKVSVDPGDWPGIVRLLPDGTRDETFRVPAPWKYTFPWSSGVANVGFNTAVLQKDGRIVVGGYFTEYQGVPLGGIARLNTDGSLDTSFKAGSGAQIGSAPQPHSIAHVSFLAVDQTDRILVQGHFGTFDGKSLVWGGWARLNPDGSFDGTYVPGADGTPSQQFANMGLGGAQFVHKLPDGDWIVAGPFTSALGWSTPHLARLNADPNASRGIGFSSEWYATAEGATNARVTVLRYGSSSEPITIRYRTRNGTANAGEDYSSAEGTLTIGAGENSKGITLRTLEDGTFESIETFFMDLSLDAPGIQLGPVSSARMEIEDNEPPLNYLDPEFRTGFSGHVRSMALAHDGKVILAGHFGPLDGTEDVDVVRLNSDGSRDLAFSVAASLVTQESGECCGDVWTVAAQADGKILIGGYFTEVGGTRRPNLARLLASGGLDTSFQPEVEGATRFIAVQRDGKIIAQGDFGFLRFHPDGKLDFDINFEGGPDGSPIQLVETPDSKLLFGGWFNSWNGQPRPRLARISLDGRLDTAYEPLESTSSYDYLDRFLSFSTNGFAVVAANREDPEFGTLRTPILIGTDGQPLPSMEQLRGVGNYNNIFDGLALSDQSVLIAGNEVPSGGPTIRSYSTSQSTNPFPSLRLGALDWGLGGRGGGPGVMLVQPGGGVLVRGRLSHGLHAAGPLARLRPLPREASQIEFASPVYSAGSSQGSVHVKIVRNGENTRPARVKFLVIQGEQSIWSDTVQFGGLETNLTVGIPIKFLLPAGGERQLRLALSEPSEGSMLGVSSALLRVQDDAAPGALDWSFSLALSSPPDSGSVYVSSLRKTPEGRIGVWGNFSAGEGYPHWGYVLLNAAGGIDTNATTRPPIEPLAIDDAGRSFGVRELRLLRYRENGRVDPSFDASFLPSAPNVMLQQPDGKFVVAGYFTNVNGVLRPSVARLHSDGKLDETFALVRGASDANGLAAWISGLSMASEGKIYVSGNFVSIGGESMHALARLHSDGKVDASYRPFPRPNPGQEGSISVMTSTPDGSVVAVAYLPSMNPNGGPPLWRISADGHEVANIGWGTGPKQSNPYCLDCEGYIHTMSALPDGSVLVGGGFTSFNGFSIAGLAKLEFSPLTTLVIESARMLPDGLFELRIRGRVDRTYRMETSEDLMKWAPAGTFQLRQPSDTITDINAGGTKTRFYRVRED